jgi:hypothetical protein
MKNVALVQKVLRRLDMVPWEEKLALEYHFISLEIVELSVKGPAVLPSPQTWKGTKTRNLSVAAKATGVQNCRSP